MERIPVILASALLSLSGCTGGDAPTGLDADEDDLLPASWEALGAIVGATDHDHTDRDIHVEVSRNVTVLAQSTLSDDGLSLGEYTEADVGHGMVAVAIVTGPGSTLEIVLIDQAKLPAVEIVGRFTEPNAYGDVKFDDAVPWVYVPYASGRGFSVWDVTDPSTPRRLGEAPGEGCHMLHPMRSNGEPFVWCASLLGALGYRIVDIPGGGVVGVAVGAAEPQSDPETLRYTDYYAALGPTPRALRVHDMTAQLDPLTKTPVLVTAHELHGIRVFDVTAPSAPVEIGAWRGQGLDHPNNRVHTVGLFEHGGRRIAVGATETFHHVTPEMYIVDFTDYANPQLLAAWSPPGITDDGSITFALHNWQYVAGRFYVTNFHAGLWVLDFDDPAEPRPIALRTPVIDTEYPRPGEQSLPGVFTEMNQFWDVLVVDGYVIVTDMSAGIEVLHVDGDPAGDVQWHGFT